MQIDREAGRELEIRAIFRTPPEYVLMRNISLLRVEVLATLLEQSTMTPAVPEQPNPDKQDKCVIEVVFCLKSAENNF